MKLLATARGWLRRRSVALKHFLFLFAGSLLLFGMLVWSNLQDAESLFRKQVLSDAEVIIDRTNLYLNAYLDNVQNVLLLLSTRDDLLLEGKENEAAEVLRSYAAMNSSLYKTVYMVREDGKVLSNTQVYYEIIGNPHIAKLLDKARTTHGLFITEPYDSPLSGRTVAFVLPLADAASAFKGMVVLEIDLVRLTNVLAQFMNSKNQTFAIVTGKGSAVQTFDATMPLSSYALLPYDTRVFPPQLDPSFVERMAGLPVGVTDLGGADGGLVAVKSGMNRLGWHFIAFYKESFFYQNVISLYRNYRTAALFWVAVLLVSTYIVSRYFTYPIRKLAAKMDRVRDMEVLPSIGVTREDEIGRLAKSYNAMMERIHRLLQETKEAEQRKKLSELKMLQSQIAPHFLYNTLACIGSLAKQQRTDDVRETIRALIGLLSFSFDKASEFVTLREELESIRLYAYIQKVRYGDKFELQIEAAEDSLPCRVLKLTLQPFVENAIFHGLAPLKRTGFIRVRAKKTGHRLIVTIRDNGRGMDGETLTKLFEESGKAPSKHRFTGIGIRNVQERIRLHYGMEYGLRIASAPHVGTLVRIVLPAETASDEAGGDDVAEQLSGEARAR